MKNVLEKSDIGKVYVWTKYDIKKEGDLEGYFYFSVLLNVSVNEVKFLYISLKDGTFKEETFRNSGWSHYIRPAEIKILSTKLSLKMYPNGFLKNGYLYLNCSKLNRVYEIYRKYRSENEI